MCSNPVGSRKLLIPHLSDLPDQELNFVMLQVTANVERAMPVLDKEGFMWKLQMTPCFSKWLSFKCGIGETKRHVFLNIGYAKDSTGHAEIAFGFYPKLRTRARVGNQVLGRAQKCLFPFFRLHFFL